jgi:trimeric autotransporter adhesin
VNGSPDNTFDGDAKVITNINADDMAFAMKLSGLRIYVAGQSNNDMFTIVAYLNDATQIVLPLHFTNTKAFIKNSAVQVEWTAENELNVKEYAIEKSIDGIQFNTIATLNANTTGNKNYTSLDATPFTGNNYYRIKAIDNDGKFMYSVILLVKMSGEKNIIVYPNPVKRGESLQISLQNISANKIEIINTTGQIVYSNSAKQTGSISIPFPSTMPAGQYVLRIITATEVRLQKIQIH